MFLEIYSFLSSVSIIISKALKNVLIGILIHLSGIIPEKKPKCPPFFEIIVIYFCYSALMVMV